MFYFVFASYRLIMKDSLRLMRFALLSSFAAVLCSCVVPSHRMESANPSANHKVKVFPSASSTVPPSELSLIDVAPAGRVGNLRPGDIISITLFEASDEDPFSITKRKPTPSGEFTVGPDGILTLPFGRKIDATKYTVPALQEHILRDLKRSDYDPKVSVRLVSSSSELVMVLGDVENPGSYPLKAEQKTIIDVLKATGGLKQASNRLILGRGGSHYAAAIADILNKPNYNLKLQDGDIIRIVSGENSYTIIGNIKNSGNMNFIPGQLSLLDAFVNAGGLTDEKNQRTIYLLRQGSSNADSSSILHRSRNRSRFDLHNANSYLQLANIEIQNKDIILVTGTKPGLLQRMQSVLGMGN
ncbi:MAG: polysaccharide biosynthesis/export family protein [Brucella intermedia]